MTTNNQVQFDRYLDLLLKWNKTYNLTSILDPKEIQIKHFEDSLIPLKFIPESGELLDLGAGGGFPGIPIKIERPNLRVDLVEATLKKINFMNEVIRQLSLKNIRAIHGRAESPSKELKKYDVVISRATWSLNNYLVIAEKYLKDDGIIIAMKSKKAPEELNEALKTIVDLRLELTKQYKYTLSDNESKRVLFIFNKKF